MAVGWRSRRDDLPPLQKYITRPSSQLTGGSEIDHVLYNSPAMRIRNYSTGSDGLWAGLSDIAQYWSDFPTYLTRNFRTPQGLTKNSEIFSVSRLDALRLRPHISRSFRLSFNLPGDLSL